MADLRSRRPFRLLLQGEGVKPTGEWFGFYAARQVSATSETEAVAGAEAMIDADWEGPSEYLGRLEHRVVVALWNSPRLALRRFRNAGHSFYQGDADAQLEALKMETKVAAAPREVRERLLGDLA